MVKLFLKNGNGKNKQLWIMGNCTDCFIRDAVSSCCVQKHTDGVNIVVLLTHKHM